MEQAFSTPNDKKSKWRALHMRGNGWETRDKKTWGLTQSSLAKKKPKINSSGQSLTPNPLKSESTRRTKTQKEIADYKTSLPHSQPATEKKVATTSNISHAQAQSEKSRNDALKGSKKGGTRGREQMGTWLLATTGETITIRRKRAQNTEQQREKDVNATHKAKTLQGGRKEK